LFPEFCTLRRALLLLLAFLCVSLLLLSCGYTSPSSSSNASGIKYRAFVSQDVSAGNVVAGVHIVDAQKDLLDLGTLISGGATPGMMVVTPNRNQTLVFSSSDLTLNLINNASETNVAHLTLPGATHSIVVSPDSLTAYVAVPTAPVVGQQPGAIEVLSLSTGAITGEISCFVQNPPGPCLPQDHTYQYLSISHNGNRILAFSPDSDSVFVITPGNLGSGNTPVVEVPGFDKPVQAFFSNDDSTAYVVNCGANCSGAQASVQSLDLISNIPGTAVDIPAAEVATLVGTTMYLAGTPVPPSACTGQQTQATTCGLLTVFDLTTMSVTNASHIIITDGYHDHIAMGANGQLFVGGNTCTEISQGGETRGCLSIYNTQTGAVVIPAARGDVTGLQPIANRSVVYLVQNGELWIYDTATDKLQKTQVDISGVAVDVKTVD
jgi:hypothetical protein